MRSPTYWHPLFYQTAMRLLYGRGFADRYRAVASAIPTGCSVVDICCGDAYLFRRFLSEEAVTYLGLDINPVFVRWLLRRGVPAREFDVRSDAIPEADVILMQASLYQFIPDERKILDKMVSSARRCVVLAEPIKNLSTSSSPVLSWLGRRLTDPGTGEVPSRFDTDRLGRLVEPYKTDMFELIAGGRESLVRIVV
ncbi:MAG: methionine biosynthesis protein MetW [bacterium]